MRVLLVSHHRTYKTRIPWRVEGVARVLAQAGHEVTILCTADHARLARREFSSDGIRFVETPDLLWGRLRSGWDPWNAWQRLRWLARSDFDLVHAFETRPSVIHPLLRRLRRRPAPLVIDWCDWWGRGGLIAENRPAWYPALFGGLETYYEEHYRRRADATTVIARGLARRAEALGAPPASIFRFPNGCWPDRLRPTDPQAHRADFGFAPDELLVGFNALDVTLGFELMLAGFALAAARHPRLTLVLTGRLPARARRALQEAGLAGRARNLGFVPAEAYPRVLGCIDLFLLPFVDRPANYGRWPGRINDYLCAGRPVITQPVGEMKELLERESIGLLCAAEPAALADALLRLAASPEERARCGRRARELAEGPLAWPAYAPVLAAAYACAHDRFRARHG